MFLFIAVTTALLSSTVVTLAVCVQRGVGPVTWFGCSFPEVLAELPSTSPTTHGADPDGTTWWVLGRGRRRLLYGAPLLPGVAFVLGAVSLVVGGSGDVAFLAGSGGVLGLVGYRTLTDVTAVTISAHGTVQLRSLSGTHRSPASRVMEVRRRRRCGGQRCHPYTQTSVRTAGGRVRLAAGFPALPELIEALYRHRPQLEVSGFGPWNSRLPGSGTGAYGATTPGTFPAQQEFSDARRYPHRVGPDE